MQGFFISLGLGLLALLGVAALVALVEYLRSLKRPAPLPVAPLARAVSVDLDLGAMGTAAAPDAPDADDQQQRQATVGRALARMAKPSDAWIETRPSVLGDARATEPTP